MNKTESSMKRRLNVNANRTIRRQHQNGNAYIEPKSTNVDQWKVKTPKNETKSVHHFSCIRNRAAQDQNVKRCSYFGATIDIGQPVWENVSCVNSYAIWQMQVKHHSDNSHLIRLNWSANEFHVMIQNVCIMISVHLMATNQQSFGCHTQFTQSIYL